MNTFLNYLYITKLEIFSLSFLFCFEVMFSRVRANLFRVHNAVNARRFSVQRQAVMSAVQTFMKQRRAEIEHELQFKGENATEEEKTSSAKLVELLAQEVKEDSQWRDFGFDGLDEVECVLTIEDALNIRLPDEEFHAIHGVQDAIRIVEKYKQ